MKSTGSSTAPPFISALVYTIFYSVHNTYHYFTLHNNYSTNTISIVCKVNKIVTCYVHSQINKTAHSKLLASAIYYTSMQSCPLTVLGTSPHSQRSVTCSHNSANEHPISPGNWSPSDFPTGTSWKPYSQSGESVNRDLEIVLEQQDMVDYFYRVYDADWALGKPWEPKSLTHKGH